MSKRIVYRLIWMPCAIALIVTFVMFLGHVVTEAAPAAMTVYTMSDKSLQMLHPANWEATESSQHGVGSSVKFVVDEYSGIRFNTDLMGSLMADIDKANNAQFSNLAGMSAGGASTPQGPGSVGAGDANAAQLPAGMEGGETAAPQLPAAKSPLQKSHERKGQELEKSTDFENYREGETRKVQVAGQEALVTDFTYTEHGSQGDQEEVGRRVTALLGERRLLILSHCPQAKSKQLMPLFDKMMESLQVSPNGGQ
jgi:hypothetical protein